MKKLFSLIILLPCLAFATDRYPKNPAIDITHYTFRLEVNDSTNVIAGLASVQILFKGMVTEFELDLANKNQAGAGMEVTDVTLQNQPLSFTHKNDRLKISLPKPARQNDQLTFIISYGGIPQDGLIIGVTKFGDRGFFGDNWPNRGHHWLPVIDHPSDKASVDFIIIAPLHYAVVANGIKIEESLLDKKRKLTHWHEEVPLPPKVMVAGIAQFAVQYAGKVGDISVQSWVYPQNREAGFHDYAVALNVLEYFQSHIAPYPFKKLANVQSKTKFGGLENANTIFYFENSVNGKGEREGLIAHEVAHQWFGDSASEDDWHHVWLSEGFATYFGHLYEAHANGRDHFVSLLQKDRTTVINFYSKNQAPVVDTTITDINKVLSPNTYQKASWVLHMLRHKVGEDLFWKGIREYYRTYCNSNALTADFQRVMETTSGQDLEEFFDQWIYHGGHPSLKGTWQYDAKSHTVVVNLSQLQPHPFKAPLEIGITYGDGKKETRTVLLEGKAQKISLQVEASPGAVVLDPDTWLLFEGALTKK